MKLRSLAALVALTCVGTPLAAQLEPPSTGGAPKLDRLLQELSEGRRVLVIGAHPDDEDSQLLAWVSQGRGAEAAYLSLTRGDGGQNLIGEELGIPLGIIRSRELQAARAIDGAEQFFTRAFDFGYTRSLPETERFWPPDSVLKDAVRVVRRFQPHVIVAVFSGTPRDGHGQHQMSGVIAQQVYEAAGDPDRFPELATEEGLAPWTPLKLYRSTRFDRGATTAEFPTGGIDPRTGKTYAQIAAEGRSQHRSQSFGRLQSIGPASGRIGLMKTRVTAPPDAGIFAGIPADTTMLARQASSLRHTLVLSQPGALATPLAELERARPGFGARSSRTRTVLDEAMATSLSLMMDAWVESETLVPGQAVPIHVDLYNGGTVPIALRGVQLMFRDGPAAVSPDTTEDLPSSLEPGALVSRTYTVRVPADAEPTQPYYLERPMVGEMYDWSTAAPQVRGLPFQPADLRVEYRFSALDAPFALEREVTDRYADQGVGEVRQPVHVVPAVDVRLAPDHVVWSSEGNAERTFTVRLKHNGAEPQHGTVRLAIDGWSAPETQPFALDHDGETRTLTFQVRRPANVTRGGVEVRAIARTDDGRQFDQGVEVVDYPHIRATPYVVAAKSEVRVARVVLPDLHRLGYVRGASDRVPEALSALGLPLELLDPTKLANGDLAPFDAIVIGARAYETDTALVRHNDRLLEYVRNGGLLVVQYQQYQFVQGGYAPYPITISRPHDRVTDQNSPVRVLLPELPVFHTPHTIGAQDWEGWPQERGLYFGGTWDPAYTAPLEMEDPEGNPIRGGLLIAKYGEGTYVYTGIAFFRSIPAGVPGPVRLFLNILALGGE